MVGFKGVKEIDAISSDQYRNRLGNKGYFVVKLVSKEILTTGVKGCNNLM